METDEEERELDDFCAEILKNWNDPIYSEMEIMHQNPFYVSRVYDVEQLNIVETEISISKRKYADPKHEDEGEKGLKGEQGFSSPGSIIPMLVADTFHDRLRGHSTDGIDIAALLEVKGAKTCKHEGGAMNVSANKPKEAARMSSWFKCKTPTVNRMPISGDYRRWSATRNAGLTEFRLCTPRYFFRKLGAMLYSNKKINTEDFREMVWRNPGVDTTDFFNYGLDEEQWKDYCKQMKALIHEQSFGQSKTDTDTDTSCNSIEDGEIREEDPHRGNYESFSSIYSCSSGATDEATERGTLSMRMRSEDTISKKMKINREWRCQTSFQ